MKKLVYLHAFVSAGLFAISPLGFAKNTDATLCLQPQTAPIFKTFYDTQKGHFDQRVLWESAMYSPLERYNDRKNSVAQYQGVWEQIKDMPDISDEEKAQFKAMTVVPELSSDEIEGYNMLVKAKKLYFGDNIKMNQVEALNLLLDADEKGSHDAYELYSTLAKHCPDQEVQANAVKALTEVAKVYGEYEDYLTPAWAYLAHAYAYGVGVAVDEEKAIQYWQKARRIYSLQFDVGGFVGFLMGQMVEQKPYLKGNLGDAMNYYKIATRADENNIAAQNAILRLLKSNKKFDDLSYEVELFEATEEAKYDEDPKSAYFTLSELYAQKQWEIYDPQQSIQWLTKAAEAGHDRAQLNLALAYDEGNMVKADGTKALKLYQQYFNQGSLLSGIFLLDRLEKGSKSIQANPTQAKIVRQKLTKMYRDEGHTGEIPKPEELRLMQRMY